MSDRLALANAIEDAGIPRDKAEQLAATIFDGTHDTKAELGLLHAEVVGMRSASTGVQDEIALLAHKADVRSVSVEAARVRDEVTALRGAIQAMERLDATVKAQPNAIMLRFGTLMVVLTGVILAALRYLPPGHGG
jgi:hypothetical protein